VIALRNLLSEPRDGIVPPTGFSAWLTTLTAAAMAFLAVFALALSAASGRLAERWENELSRTATIRVSSPAARVETDVAAVLAILSQTPGVAEVRRLSEAERHALVEPWFGPGLPLDALPIPELVEVVQSPEGVNAEGLALRLAAEVPGALYDDHTAWRAPLVGAASRLRVLGLAAVVLIAAAMAAMVALAAQASLAANRRVIEVLRLIGAHDLFIARAFVRRFTRRALLGAAAGTLAGLGALALVPGVSEAGGFLTDLEFSGAGWIAPLLVPPVAALAAYGATRLTALRMLRELA
jgi:cell division transport system permease protein